MKNNSATEVGQTASADQSPQAQRIDAINQVFALFKLNYHNQFFRAFSQESELNSIKRLWLDSLAPYSTECLLKAARSVIKTSEYLPTLKTMLSHCDRISQHGLPDVRVAYAEACCAASPKVEQKWSHAAVYLAGQAVGWHFLQSNSEAVAYPAFKNTYELFVERARCGEKLEYDIPEKIAPPKVKPASPETSKKYLDSLQNLLD